MSNLTDHRALVTGASSGIGAAIARQLAARGADLTLSARRADRLEALAAELTDTHGVAVRVIPADLAAPDGARRLWDEVAAAGERIDILVNNAGIGDHRAFAEVAWADHATMIQLNVAALVELTHRFLGEALGTDRRAYILNVSSVVAYMAVPHFATYAASKAYVLTFSESLAFELRGTNASVTCLCPGGTSTEFSDRAGMKLGRMQSASMMSAERVARIGVRAMLRGRRNVVAGASNKLMVAATRVTPRAAIAYASRFALGEAAATSGGGPAKAETPTADVNAGQGGDAAAPAADVNTGQGGDAAAPAADVNAGQGGDAAAPSNSAPAQMSAREP